MAKQRKNLNPEELFKPPSQTPSWKERFDCLLDGEIWEYEMNIDFRGSGKNFVQTAKNWAREKGVGLNINMSKGTSIYLQIREPTRSELSRSESSSGQVLLRAWKARQAKAQQAQQSAAEAE